MTTTEVADALDVIPMSAALGAEVRGLSLTGATATDAETVRQLLVEHMVLFFPDQHMEPGAHVEFAKHFGPLEAHPHYESPVPGRPEIFQLEASKGGIADEWHTDLTFLDSPSVMSILNMIECPPHGGDTMWTNLCLAYEQLSEPIKTMITGLTALHDTLPHNRPDRMAIHPMVRLHPDTGRPVLYVNEHFTRRIVELGWQESDALLEMLTEWVSEERFTVRYKWAPGTIAIWDNRCTQHCVLNDFEGERIIQRVTVMGDHPVGDEPRWQPRTNRPGAMSRHDRQLRDYLKHGTASA